MNTSPDAMPNTTSDMDRTNEKKAVRTDGFSPAGRSCSSTGAALSWAKT